MTKKKPVKHRALAIKFVVDEELWTELLDPGARQLLLGWAGWSGYAKVVESPYPHSDKPQPKR